MLTVAFNALVFSTLMSLNMTHTVDVKQVECLAQAIHMEAGGESFRGKQAVSNVIMNRLKSPDFTGSSVCSIVSSKEFSFGYKKNPIIKINDEYELDNVKVSILLATATLLGIRRDITKGATYYKNVALSPKSKWWDSTLVQVAHIGHHTFYKLKPGLDKTV